jgi:hypothetical protein
MDLDYPHCRAATVCPICDKGKSIGLVACWPCFRRFKMHDGKSAFAKAVKSDLDGYETYCATALNEDDDRPIRNADGKIINLMDALRRSLGK